MYTSWITIQIQITWKVRLMGGRDQGLRSRVVVTSVTSARRLCSDSPGNRFVFHTWAHTGDAPRQPLGYKTLAHEIARCRKAIATLFAQTGTVGIMIIDSRPGQGAGDPPVPALRRRASSPRHCPCSPSSSLEAVMRRHKAPPILQNIPYQRNNTEETLPRL